MSESDAELFSTMRESVRRIGLYVQGFTPDSFLEDQRTIDAVALNILVIGECANRLSDAAKLKTATPWRKIVALRHRIAHGYTSVDPDMLWAIALNGAPALLSEIDALERR